MCGIVGMTTNKSFNKERFIESTRLLTHRGPDEEGYFFDKVAFGHRRLVVIDKDNGKQPMSYKNCTMIYNGELYNTEEIRKDLIELGYSFIGHSDTEVLLKSYYEWNEKCLEKLNGIFSFAIFDGDKLFLARDRVGVKPLYYSINGKDIIFSSEIKSILYYLDNSKVDEDGLKELLGLGPSHTLGKTIYKDVFQLKPGHYMYFDGSVTIHEYWNVSVNNFNLSFDDTVKEVRNLLEDAIKRQLVSDVPLCTFLSGGVDSSIITAVAANNLDSLTTYSIDYEDNDFKTNDFQVSKDLDYIKYVTNMYNTRHIDKVISQEELVDTLKRSVELRDSPGMADIDSSLYWFCLEIKKEHTVGLSGECADEIFGGYPWFYRDTDSTIFPWLRDLDARVDLLKDEWRESLKIREYVKDKYDETLAEIENMDSHQQMMYLNIKWFMTTLLDRKDRMSMGASLEVRVPFADHRLVEFLFNVPKDYKFYKQEKGLLREAMKDLLPKEILNRKKNPYPKTHSEVYTRLIKDKLSEVIKDKNSILNILFKKDRLIELVNTGGESFEKPWFGQLMTGPQLLAYLYQMDYWYKKYNIELV
ncbi:asparagine synthase (glutamine-hydrolyzing) [Mycoplasmatota bacterium]|nr:asparagine synthase (glutamine-hydrolyzing) [Mycoplasmatota bacterium]